MKRRLKDVRHEAREFLKRYPDATPDEIAALYEWMRDGNSPYENGDGVCDDNCYPMDFIGTMRFWDSMYQEWLEDPEGFMAEHCPNTAASEELNPEGWMDLSRDE